MNPTSDAARIRRRMIAALLCAVVAAAAIWLLARAAAPDASPSPAAGLPDDVAPSSRPTDDEPSAVGRAPFVETAPSDARAQLLVVDDATGNAVVAAAVRSLVDEHAAVDNRAPDAATDAAGFAFVDAGVRLLIVADGYAASTVDPPLRAGERRTVRLPREARVVGRVLRDTGEPLPGLRVLAAAAAYLPDELFEGASLRLGDVGRRSVAFTDAEGRFRIVGLPPGEVRVSPVTDDYVVADHRTLGCTATSEADSTLEIRMIPVYVAAVVVERVPKGWQAWAKFGRVAGFEPIPRVSGGNEFRHRPHMTLEGNLMRRCQTALALRYGGDAVVHSAVLIPQKGPAAARGDRVDVEISCDDRRLQAVAPLRPAADWKAEDAAVVDAEEWTRGRTFCRLSVRFEEDGRPAPLRRIGLAETPRGYALDPRRFPADAVEAELLVEPGRYTAVTSLDFWQHTRTFDPVEIEAPEGAAHATISLSRPVAVVRLKVVDRLGREIKAFHLRMNGVDEGSGFVGRPPFATYEEEIEFSVSTRGRPRGADPANFRAVRTVRPVHGEVNDVVMTLNQ